MKNNFDSYVISFLDYLVYELNYSSKTRLTYEEALKTYNNFLNKEKINFLNVNIDQANKYKAYLIMHKYDNKTSSLILSAIRSFYNYLVEIKVIKSNIFLNIHNPNNYIEARNTFIIIFLYATGLRVSEAVNLKVKDLNNDYTIRIIGKGNKERIIYYDACLDSLNKYLNNIRPHLTDINSDYLFISKSGKP